MSTYINNGLERTLDISIITNINNVETARTDYSGCNAFGSYPAITYTQLATMTDENFNIRLNAFISYLEGIYSGLYINPSSGTTVGVNAEITSSGMCPIGSSVLLPENLIVANISGTTQVYATSALAVFTSLNVTIEFKDNTGAFLTTSVNILVNTNISNKISPNLSIGATSIISAVVVSVTPTYDSDYIYVY